MGPYRRLKDAKKLGTGPATKVEPKKETKVDADKAVVTGSAHPTKKEHTK